MDIPIKSDNVKLKKKKIIYTCWLCGKNFKNENIYNAHVKKQLCVKKENRTYCEICDLVFPTRKEYLKHLISPLHYKNLEKIEIEEFEIPIDDKVEADPYLNQDDIKKLNQSYGDGISICFKNNDLLNIKFDDENQDQQEESEEEELEQEESKQQQKEPEHEQEIEPEQKQEEEKFTISERQTKILIFLKKIENFQDSEKKFLQSLSKLNLDDYKGLITAIISDEYISIKGKQKYIQVLKLFKQLLEKKLEGGVYYYNSIQIINIINFLKF